MSHLASWFSTDGMMSQASGPAITMKHGVLVFDIDYEYHCHPSVALCSITSPSWRRQQVSDVSYVYLVVTRTETATAINELRSLTTGLGTAGQQD